MKKVIKIHSEPFGSEKKKGTGKNPQPFFVVGIGASAGGLEALMVFFDHMPANSGMAFIVVQHLDPTHASLLSELIAGHTKMKVSEIKNGETVNPNQVYVIPPNKDLKIQGGYLRLSKPKEQRNARRTIDSFFHSLADDQKEHAIGVVLSGTGTEGTLGLQYIKSAGGSTVVQDPKTAQFDGMPQSAISANAGDAILPPERMSAYLLRLLNNGKHVRVNPQTESTNLTPEQLQKILLIIRGRSGYDFSNYKTNTIIRRISKRMSLNQNDSVIDYIRFLQKNPEEIDQLYKNFLIGVTTFFRDKDVFSSVEKKAIPHLLQHCVEKQELRIWVCGCSTGEEAYSLAILFREALERNKQFVKIVIFASDIDKDAIEFARLGIYSKNAVSNVSRERLSRYFIRIENTYQLRKEIREMIVFAHHNLIKDPPFSKIDMITCRNVLIYLNSDLQKKIIPVFHYSLNHEGILVLGTSESIGDFVDYFSVFDSKVKIFKKKSDVIQRKSNASYALPFTHQNPIPPKLPMTNEIKKKINVAGLTEKILLGQYAPPTVLVDKYNNAIYFSGNTGLYLEPPNGEANLNILEMARQGLKSSLDAAIQSARIKKSEVQVKNLDVKVNDHFRLINLIVKPVLTKDMDLGALIIIFESAEKPLPKSKTVKMPVSKLKSTELEKELRITREHLQIAINELETSNEDLQTANEEYQSSNEELQSTNEELETSREELQSVNEELITVNSELTVKIEQLSQANDDLNNLLSSIEIATVFLDRELKIKRFTPSATKIFNLIPSDINRPVTHLTTSILYKDLATDVKNALKTLAIRTIDVTAVDGTWYHVRILPYRTAENIIEGVLITFIDITEQKIVEERLKTTNEHLNLIMENLPAVPFTCRLTPELKFSFVGKSCEPVTGFLPEQFINKSAFWTSRIHPEDKKKILSAFSSVTKKGSIDVLFRWKCSDGKYKSFINYIRYAASENSRPAYIVGVWQETPKNTISLIK